MGGAVKGFKEGMREAETPAEQAKVANQTQANSAPIDVEAKTKQ